MSAPALSVEAVRKSYGDRVALDGVSLTVEPGEFVALLGPNGAGKSTLFQLLTGLFVPEAGRIAVAGHDLAAAPLKALAALGVVFQQPTLDLDLSVAANLRFHARLQGLGAGSKSRIREALARVGLAEQADRAARELSGGNRRRVELARSLLHAPALLLLDEPSVGLDPGARARLREQVAAECLQRGLGVLWATHLVDEAEAADRVVVLHQGRRIAMDRPAELRRMTGTASLDAAFFALVGEAPPAAAARL